MHRSSRRVKMMFVLLLMEEDKTGFSAVLVAVVAILGETSDFPTVN